MDIKRFTSSINSKGILKTNRFEAQFIFTENSYMRNSRVLDENMLTLRCDSATLPGVSFASADGPPRLGYGPVEKRPYNPMFEDLALTFMVDAGSRIHKMFYEWASCIVNFEGYGASRLDRAGDRSPTNALAYEVGYRDRYACTLILKVFSTSGKQTMTFTAYNAFPMSLPQMAMNWAEGDILRLPVPFAYTDFTVQYADFRGSDPVETGRDTRSPNREQQGPLES
jgi:hypothetical protein